MLGSASNINSNPQSSRRFLGGGILGKLKSLLTNSEKPEVSPGEEDCQFHRGVGRRSFHGASSWINREAISSGHVPQIAIAAATAQGRQRYRWLPFSTSPQLKQVPG